MYYIYDTSVLDAIASDCRTFRAMLELNDGTICSGSCIGETTIEHTLTDDETIQIGGVLSRRAVIHLRADCAIPKGTGFRLFLYMMDWNSDAGEPTKHQWLRQYTHEELQMLTHAQVAARGMVKGGVPIGGLLIPFGEFVVCKSTINGCMAEIIAYDRLRFSDVLYIPTIPFPATAEQVENDILGQLGIAGREGTSDGNLRTCDSENVLDANGEEVLVSDGCTFMIPEAPVGKSCREVLGAIAGVSGGNGMLNRDGLYSVMIFHLSKSGGIPYDADKIDEPELAEADMSVPGFRCILDAENELTVGNPDAAGGVEFECPYMTQERLNAIWNDWKNVSWRPAKLYERLADPRRDLGDNPKYRGSYTVPITSLTYHFDGGLSSDIASPGNTENDNFQGVIL